MIFAESYHTALVMGLLAAALLRNPLLAVDEGTHCSEGACDAMLELLLPTSRQPQWMDELATAWSYERNALAAMVADIGLRRAVAGSRIDVVVAIIQTSLDHQIQPTAAMLAAADLLQRFAQSGLTRGDS